MLWPRASVDCEAATAMWKRIPDGTWVVHLEKGYEGWIDGQTSLKNLHDGPDFNPDHHSQYRIRVCEEGKFRFAAERNLKILNDINEVFIDATRLQRKSIERQNFKELFPGLIWYLDRYHARPDLARSRKTTSSCLNTSMIGILKYASSQAVDHFVAQLDPMLRNDFPIAIVPSSNPSSSVNGMRMLVQKLASSGRYDATSCLRRHTHIWPSHIDVESRNNPSRHLGSIGVMDRTVIAGRVVLLLDDIARTGTSLLSCRTLLIQAGAREVICLALGDAVQ